MGTHSASESQPLDTVSDLDLVELTRTGDSGAFGELWRRHSAAGRAVARSYSTEPDDVLAESFARILKAIRSGGGPSSAFRAYLFTTIRSVAYQSRRGPATDTVDDFDAYVDVGSEEAATLAALDRSLTAQAFRSLPTRWQEALWYSEVEQLSSAEIAPLLGMKPNAVNALTFRAREGLRQAWIQAHLSRAQDSECSAVIDRLGAYARGTLGPRETRRVEAHLMSCQSCQIVAEEAREVSAKLALVLLPLAAGLVGATGYAAWLQTGDRGLSPVALSAPADGGAAPLTAAIAPGARGVRRAGSGGTAFASAGFAVTAAAVVALIVVPLSLTHPPASYPGAREFTPAAERVAPNPPPAAIAGPPPSSGPTAPDEPPAGPGPLAGPANRDEQGVRSSEDPTAPANPAAGPEPEPQPPSAGPDAPSVPQPPAAPAVSVAPSPEGRYLPEVSGTTVPNTLVQIISPDGTVLGETTADGAGAFQTTDLPGLGFGTTLVGARTVAADGLVSEPSAFTPVTLAAISLLSPVPGDSVSSPGFVLQAEGTPDATVLIEAGTATLAPLIDTVGPDGRMSEDIIIDPAQTGDLVLTLRYIDQITGRVGPALRAVLHVVPAAP